MNFPVDIQETIKTEFNYKSKSEEVIEISSISLLENIISSYRSLNDNVFEYKENIKKMRVNATRLKEEKEKLQLEENMDESGINNLSNNIPANDVDLIYKEIKNNNSSTKEDTCNMAIKHIEGIKSNISGNSKDAKELVRPLEITVKLLKVQVKYTRELEGILELFNKKKKIEDKIKESNEIISMLSEQLDS